MDSRPELAARLEDAERGITEAKARITRQEVVTARLAAVGMDADPSRMLLERLREALVEMYRTRRLIMREIASASR